ncbi:hypothetical protein [Burkholderia cepacia]|uniref:hypothetical protein n=1 Tax=Burkholderia cepacia TaxID=292 RepID=UPI002AB7D4B7|nr:hypothetical protein [Burkholderia cepacia]
MSDQVRRERVAKALRLAAEKSPRASTAAGSVTCRVNDFHCLADAIIAELDAANQGQPWRSAVDHIAAIIAVEHRDENIFAFTLAAGDAIRAFSSN